ncbi:DUF664 domain-containing protein [Corynebacterium sp. H128]|uniref:mycothiol transferase n=1 Tax=unclassified Corynebacterium TaxID=2624378 RepID=UPI0030AD00FC
MGFLTPNAAGEIAVHKTYIFQQLAQIRTTVHGLTDEQAHSTPSASSLNLTGLLLHAAEVALFWSASVIAAPNPPSLPAGFEENHMLDQLIADERPLAQVLETFDHYVELARHNLEQLSDLDTLVPVPESWSPWIPAELTHWETRWCLHHITAEIARHAGHADIIRESIDGKGAFELNDLAG